MIAEAGPPPRPRRVRVPVRFPAEDHAAFLAWCARRNASPPAQLRRWITGELTPLVRRSPETWDIERPILPEASRPHAKIWVPLTVTESIRLGWYAACRGASKSRVVRTWVAPRLADELAAERSADSAA